MRLSEWREAAPAPESMTDTVMGVLAPVLRMLGADADPHAWVAWGEEPASRYMVLVPTRAGLVTCGVRVYLPGEGPRASGKVVRWSRVQLGELGVETQGQHRLVSFQVEGLILRGADSLADGIAAFALVLFDAVDGRPPSPEPLPSSVPESAGASGAVASPAAAAPPMPAAPRMPVAPPGASGEAIPLPDRAIDVRRG